MPSVAHQLAPSGSSLGHSSNSVDRRDEDAPARALRGQDAAAFARQPVVAAPALAGLLDPAALDPATALEAVEQRVERGDVKSNSAARALLDKFADFVAVARTGFRRAKE